MFFIKTKIFYVRKNNQRLQKKKGNDGFVKFIVTKCPTTKVFLSNIE